MSFKSFAISLIILLLTIVSVTAIASRGQPVVLKTNLENLPMEINGYKGTEDFFTEGVYEILNADKHIYRHYKTEDGRKVDLYIGYYGTAKGGRTGHNPYACLPGAGWGIVESRKILLRPKTYSDFIKVNYILARKGDQYENVLHWYHSSGNKVLDTGIKQNIHRFLGRILENRNDGAFVRVAAVSNGDEIDASMKRVGAFSVKILDLLPNYWPVER